MSEKIKCLIRNKEVNSTKEEMVRQSYLGFLLYSLNYPIDQISVEVPIHHGRSEVLDVDTSKPKRADVVIYEDNTKAENIKIIVEVKKQNELSGEKQLKSYGNVTNARYLVWYNGTEQTRIWKRIQHKNAWKWNLIPILPRYGFEHGDIIPTVEKLSEIKNSVGLFKSINDFIWVNSNIKSKKDIFLQFLYILFIKLYDEMFNEELKFYILESEYKEIFEKSMCSSFEERIKTLFNELKSISDFGQIFDDRDNIELEPHLLAEIVYRLQFLKIRGSDAKGEAFQLFISPYYRGENDQYLTPEPIIKMILDILQPTLKDVILDPACGSGRFLTNTINYLQDSLDKQKIDIKNWASSHVFGIDVEKILVKISKLYMVLIGDGHTNISHDNSLRKKVDQYDVTNKKVSIVITNPPFGSSGKITDKTVLQHYDLGHIWDAELNLTDDVGDGQSQGILMLERSYQFLKSEGIIGIVLPDGVFSNFGDDYIRKWIVTHFKIITVISLPEDTFRVKTIGANVKTSVLIAEKRKSIKAHEIFFALPKTIGYNMQGEKTDSNEVLDVAPHFKDSSKQIRNKYFKLILTNEQLIDRMDASFYSFQTNIENTFPLSECCDVFIGKTPNKSNYLDKGEIKILKVRCLTNKTIDWSDKKRDYVSTKWYEGRKKELIDAKKHDIILASAAHVGRYIGDEIDIIDEIPQEYSAVIASAKIFVIRMKNIDQLNPYVLLLYLRTEEGYQQIQSIIRGQTAEIYPQDILRVRLPDKLKEISKKSGKSIQKEYEDALKHLKMGEHEIHDLESEYSFIKHDNILQYEPSEKSNID